jgi:hypothetical protein
VKRYTTEGTDISTVPRQLVRVHAYIDDVFFQEDSPLNESDEGLEDWLDSIKECFKGYRD